MEPDPGYNNYVGDDATALVFTRNDNVDLGSCWTDQFPYGVGCAESNDTPYASGKDVGFPDNNAWIEIWVK